MLILELQKKQWVAGAYEALKYIDENDCVQSNSVHYVWITS